MFSTVILPRASPNYAISIPATFRCSSAFGLSHRDSWNAEILALRILAEIDLNRAYLHRDTFIELVWSFGKEIPLPDSNR